MESSQVAAIAQALAAYGILGLGWLLFLFAMVYIRGERARYQDLVIHIIAYFTKINMVRGQDDDALDIPSVLFDLAQRNHPRVSRRRREASSTDDQE